MNEGPSLSGLLSSVIGAIRATRTRMHVEDLIRYIDVEFGEGQVTEEGDEFYVQAVQTEFDGDLAKRKAVATVLLAQSKLHARILDEIGAFLLREITDKVSKDFVAMQEQTVSECLEHKYTPWTLNRPSWAANCFISLESQSGYCDEMYLGIKAPDPTNERVKADPQSGCEAYPKLTDIANKIAGGRNPPWWPWWQHTDTRYWGPEFAARLVIESPTGKVDHHPEIQELARRIVQLAKAVEEVLAA